MCLCKNKHVDTVSSLLQVSCMTEQIVCDTKFNNLCGKAVYQHENFHSQPNMYVIKHCQ